jgi:hypothetical protein
MVERSLSMREVRGSIPRISIIFALSSSYIIFSPGREMKTVRLCLFYVFTLDSRRYHVRGDIFSGVNFARAQHGPPSNQILFNSVHCTSLEVYAILSMQAVIPTFILAEARQLHWTSMKKGVSNNQSKSLLQSY